MLRQRRGGITLAALALILGVASSAAGEDWVVTNDYDEPFFLYLRPENQRPAPYARFELAPGQTRRIQLGADRHDLQVRPASGRIIALEPTFLEGRGESRLREIVTTTRRNGLLVYEVMQQDGFELDRNFDLVLRRLQQSTWDSSYQDPNGRDVNARVSFDGDQGTYLTSTFTGQLSDVMYTPDSDTNKIIIDGKWRALGQQGRFSFQVDLNRQDQFTGEWTMQGANNGRPWRGSRRNSR